MFADINALRADGVRETLRKAQKGPVQGEVQANFSKSTKTIKKVIDLGGEPKCVLVGKKWTVEYQNGATEDKAISVEADLKQTVYIYERFDSLVKTNGKINAVVIDTCTNTTRIFDEALASMELVISKDIQI